MRPARGRAAPEDWTGNCDGDGDDPIMSTYPAWGLDVTGVSIRGVKLAERPGGKPRLIAWDVVDFAEDVEDLSALNRFSVLGRGAYHFRSRHKLKSSRVWASVRGESAFVRTVAVPPVQGETLDAILQYEAEQQVPYPLDDVYWDRRVLAIKEDGGVLATLYAVKKAVVDERLRKLSRAGIPVDAVQLRPVALQSFCAYERLLEQGTVVVDVDYAHVHVLIHHDDQTWFRVLPMGGVDLVERIRESFHTPHRESVKIAVGMKPAPDERLFEALRGEVAQDIVDEVVRTIRYYFAARPGLKSSGIVLFQSHAAVPPVRDALKRSSDLPVFVPKGFRHLEVDPAVVSAGIQDHFPSLAKAVGLALQGLSRAEVDIKLFPPQIARDLKPGRGALALGAAAILAAFLFAGYRADRVAADIRSAREGLLAAAAEGRDRGEVEEEAKIEEPVRDILRLGEAASFRETPVRLIDRIYEVLGRSEPPVGLAGVFYESSASGRLARIVIAAAPAGGEDALGAIASAAASLPDGSTILRAEADGEPWIAAEPVTVPPAEPEVRLLRHRLYHQAFKLALGGEGS